jgi:fermentation-respiration switch protein FrsA (DUF1100 family)
MPTDVLPLKPKLKRKSRAMSMIVAFIGFYLLICAAGCALQRRLIYFPTKLKPDVAEQAAAQRGFVPWKNGEGKNIGWHLPAKGVTEGSVLIVHGNGGCALQRDYIAEPIHQAASVDVFVLEYPGYGAREGSPSEKSFLAAADEAFDLLSKNNPRYLVSESLGTGVAAHVAQCHQKDVAGIVMFVPYDDFLSLAKERMRFLPVSLILLDRYNPAKWLQDYSGPVKFVIAELDEIIPARFGLKLHEGYRGPKWLEVIPQAHHNEVSGQSADWWKSVFTFWRQPSKSPVASSTRNRA